MQSDRSCRILGIDSACLLDWELPEEARRFGHPWDLIRRAVQIGETSTRLCSHTGKEGQNTAPGRAAITSVADGHTVATHLMSRSVVEVQDLQTCAEPGSTCLGALDSSRNTDRTHQWPAKGAQIWPS